MKHLRLVFIFLSLCFIVSSCKVVLLRAVGFRMPKELNEKQVERFANKMGLPLEDVYEIDTSYYYEIMQWDSLVSNTHFQPLQAMYYDENGLLKEHHVNCYAKGNGITLDWTYPADFTVFPPKHNRPADTIQSFDILKKHIRQFSFSSSLKTDDYDYVVVVIWNRMMFKQSKQLVETVQNNLKIGQEKNKVKIIYVNTDPLYANQDFEFSR